MNQKTIIIVRHGEYVGSGGSECQLSEFGKKQMAALRKIIFTYLEQIYGKSKYGSPDVKRLLFSFSSSKRAIESSTSLSDGEDMIVTELFLTERSEIKEPLASEIVNMVLSRLRHWGASVAVIVAHGDMPAVFAETVRKMAKTSEKFDQLPYTDKAQGYIVGVETGEVLKLSPDGITSLEKPKPIPIVNPNDPPEDIEWVDDEIPGGHGVPPVVWWNDCDEVFAIWEESRRNQRRIT